MCTLRGWLLVPCTMLRVAFWKWAGIRLGVSVSSAATAGCRAPTTRRFESWQWCHSMICPPVLRRLSAFTNLMLNRSYPSSICRSASESLTLFAIIEAK